MLSLQNSDKTWCINPIKVYIQENNPISIENYWELEEIKKHIKEDYLNWENLPKKIESLKNILLEPKAIQKRLAIEKKIFKKTWNLLEKLNKIPTEDIDKNLSEDKIFEKIFHKDNYFSSSSDTEKKKHKKKLTFKVNGKDRLCSWHGKIELSRNRYRIHFTYDKDKNKIRIVYIGMKLTKQ